MMGTQLFGRTQILSPTMTSGLFTMKPSLRIVNDLLIILGEIAQNMKK